jgi:PhnB protein
VVAKVPSQDPARLIHCHLRINGGNLFINDPFPEHGHPAKTPQSFSLSLHVDDAEAWWKRAVDAGITVEVPLAVAFWGEKHGQLRDRFGVAWMISGPNLA